MRHDGGRRAVRVCGQVGGQGPSHGSSAPQAAPPGPARHAAPVARAPFTTHNTRAPCGTSACGTRAPWHARPLRHVLLRHVLLRHAHPARDTGRS
eukprot:1562230-Prymnesium_polylepis.1